MVEFEHAPCSACERPVPASSDRCCYCGAALEPAPPSDLPELVQIAVGLAYTTRRVLDEYREMLPRDDAAAIEQGVTALEAATEARDAAAIQQALNDLMDRASALPDDP